MYIHEHTRTHLHAASQMLHANTNPEGKAIHDRLFPHGLLGKCHTGRPILYQNYGKEFCVSTYKNNSNKKYNSFRRFLYKCIYMNNIHPHPPHPPLFLTCSLSLLLFFSLPLFLFLSRARALSRACALSHARALSRSLALFVFFSLSPVLPLCLLFSLLFCCYIQIRPCEFLCLCACTRVYLYVCVSVCVCVFVRACVCVCVSMREREYVPLLNLVLDPVGSHFLIQ